MAAVYDLPPQSPAFGMSVAPFTALLRRVIRRFLDQPGRRALAYFHRIFDSFGDSPLLGVSALGGLVALFAYAKALLELDGSFLDSEQLISASDVADFAVRLAVPFVLLACAAASLIGGLIAVLVLNHDRRGAFWSATFLWLLLYWGCLAGFMFWVWSDRPDFESSVTSGSTGTWLALACLASGVLIGAAILWNQQSRCSRLALGCVLLAYVAFVGTLTWWVKPDPSSHWLHLAQVCLAALLTLVPAGVGAVIGILIGRRRRQQGQLSRAASLVWVSGFVVASLFALGCFVVWISQLESERAVLFTFATLGTLLIAVPAGVLDYMGRTPGIIQDDSFQGGLLAILRSVAYPAGLLAVLAGIGVILVFSRMSVLFDRELSASEPRWTHGGPICDGELVVLEAKLYPKPITVRKRMTRLGSIWIVQRVDLPNDPPRIPACAAGQQQTGASTHPAAIGLQWLLLRQEDVNCIRPFKVEDWHDPFDKKCGMEVTKVAPPPPVARSPVSIADYAEAVFGCSAESFNDVNGKALVFNFKTGEPRTRADTYRSLPATFRSVAIGKLRKRDLEGVRGAPGNETDVPVEFLDSAAREERVLVFGFASISGEPTSNQNLSERRAMSGVEFLRRRGVFSQHRGLGANLMSGTQLQQQDAGEQVAVAFPCREKTHAASELARTDNP